MATNCRQDSFDFGTVAGRAVVGAFDGGVISSDAGALLLGATDQAIGLDRRYVLMCALRRLALAGTELAKATCGSIRLKLLKIGAQVAVSVRRVKIALASSYPLQALFALAHARLRCAAA